MDVWFHERMIFVHLVGFINVFSAKSIPDLMVERPMAIRINSGRGKMDTFKSVKYFNTLFGFKFEFTFYAFTGHLKRVSNFFNCHNHDYQTKLLILNTGQVWTLLTNAE